MRFVLSLQPSKILMLIMIIFGREGLKIPTIRIPNREFNWICRDFNRVISRASTKPVKILMLIMIILMKISN